MAERNDFVRTGDARVAAIELNGSEASPWHRHTDVLERVFCLTGAIDVQLQQPSVNRALGPGEVAETEARRSPRTRTTIRRLACSMG